MSHRARIAHNTRHRGARRRTGIIAGLAACLALLPSCAADPTLGYSFQPLHDQSIRTISVPIFENYTFDSRLELMLTEAIIKELQRSTNWTVVSTSAADSTITGAITTSELVSLSRSPQTALVQEVGVRVSVDFDWKDNRTGKLLVSRRGFEGMESFVPTRGTGEPIETGEYAVAQSLARDIVATLRSKW